MGSLGPPARTSRGTSMPTAAMVSARRGMAASAPSLARTFSGAMAISRNGTCLRVRAAEASAAMATCLVILGQVQRG